MSPNKILSIRIVGNTHNPALNTLREKGYRVWIEPDDLREDAPEFIDWNAEKAGRYFSEVGPVQLLGLVTLQEHLGDNWRQNLTEPDIARELIDEVEAIERRMRDA